MILVGLEARDHRPLQASLLSKDLKLMTKFISRFVHDESGATAIEYGLIAALIAVVIISAVTTLGTTISSKFTAVTTGMTGA